MQTKLILFPSVRISNRYFGLDHQPESPDLMVELRFGTAFLKSYKKAYVESEVSGKSKGLLANLKGRLKTAFAKPIDDFVVIIGKDASNMDPEILAELSQYILNYKALHQRVSADRLEALVDEDEERKPSR